MIGPRSRPPLLTRLLEAGSRLTMPPAVLEDRRVSFIYEETGGVLSRDEIRRIVRKHRLLG